MTKSIRRISGLLFLLGVGFLAISFITVNQTSCKPFCVAAFLPLALQPDVAKLTNSQTTTDISPNPEITMRRWISREAIRLTSSYALFLALITLIVLEFFEIHYLKAVLPHHRRRLKN